MSSVETELQVLYKIGNAAVREYPYPHIYVPDIFPADFYAELRRNLPPQSAMKNLGELGRVIGTTYPARGVLPLMQKNLAALDEAQRGFWERLGNWLLGRRFADIMISKFAPYLAQRFGDLRSVRFSAEALIVRDRSTYTLGPHTDAPSKALSFLFYLPPDGSMAHLGTSIYLPRDPSFMCPGGPHHPFDQFERMLTMPYVANALFAFMKTPNSFHGVEPIEEAGVQRDLLLYDIRAEVAQQGATQQGAKFTF
ncbi:MAG TPA: hypothetical protein VGO02_06485 [Burkholderiales bacterium]|nr:hypothetical protein [Burkholderiales bacterium]